MEPVSSTVVTIVKLLMEITKAERTARRNRARCRELAERARVVDGVLRDSVAGARGDAAATRRAILCRLEEALHDALKLMQSCHRSDGWFSSFLCGLLGSGAQAARFDNVNKRISECIVDLIAANGACIEKKINQLAARDHPRTNKSKEINAGNATQKYGAKNDNNNGGSRKKGGQNGGKQGGRRGKGKKAAAVARPPPPAPALPFARAGAPCYQNGHGYAVVYHHSVEEDPNSCAVM